MDQGRTITTIGRSVGDLVAALHDDDAGSRQQARQTLVKLGRLATPALAHALRDGDETTRWEAAKALSETADPEAIPELIYALQDEDGSVRWLAAEALESIGKPALIPLLDRLIMHSESVWLREGVHYVLNRLGKEEPLRTILNPVLVRLEGIDPRLGVLTASANAIRELRAAGYK